MATYYVAKTGNNGWAGTIGEPWLTISYAESQINAGDTVYVRVGTYSENVDINSSGSSGNLRTFEAYQSEQVIITGRIVINGNYNSWNKFEHITSASPSGSERELTFYGDYNVCNDLYFHDATSSSLGIRLTGANYNTINDSVEIDAGSIYIDDNSDYNVFDGGEIGYCWSMLARVGGVGNQILNMDMHNPGQVGAGGNEADGFNLHGVDHVIRGCKIYHCFREYGTQHVDAIQWWGTVGNFTIENNIIGSYARGGYANEKDAGHIQFEGYSDNMKIRNNVFLDSQYTRVLSSSDPQTYSADNWEITGNIFRSSNIFREDLSNALYWTIKNNVFYFDGQTLAAGSGYDVDHNCYVNATMGPYDGPGSIEVSDAGFIDDSVGSGNDYGLTSNWHLESDSPLIDAANSDTGTTLDADGNSRVDDPLTTNTGTGTYEYYDIGRYEYQTGGGIKTLAGASDGVSTASATINTTVGLGGQADGGSTAVATVVFAGEKLLAGASDGSSTAGVAIKVAKDLVATSDGIATAVATVTGLEILLGGSTAGSSTAGATLALEVIVGASADTVIRANVPNDNFGTAENMQVHKNIDEGWGRVDLLRFDFSAEVPQESNVALANLELYCYDDQGAGVTIYARHLESVGNAFTEGGATFNQYDGSNSWDSGAFSAGDWTLVNQASDVSTGSDNHWFTWDVTDMAQHCLDNHAGILEVVILSTQTDAYYWYFRTKEYGTEAVRPKLSIEYTGPPSPTVELAGTSTGGSTASASTGVGFALAGTSDGSSTAGASVDIVNDLVYLAGQANGLSTVTGILPITTKKLAGQSDGSSTAQATRLEDIRFNLADTSELFRTW